MTEIPAMNISYMHKLKGTQRFQEMVCLFLEYLCIVNVV